MAAQLSLQIQIAARDTDIYNSHGRLTKYETLGEQTSYFIHFSSSICLYSSRCCIHKVLKMHGMQYVPRSVPEHFCLALGSGLSHHQHHASQNIATSNDFFQGY